MRSLTVWPAVVVSVVVARPVGADAPPGRYTASGGTVVDGATHLIWQQVLATSGGDDGAGRSTWANAKSYCASLGGGYRLPTAKELLTIVDFSRTNPSIDTSAGGFPGTPSEPFWTATPLAGSPPTGAWFISFDDGYAGNGDMTQPSRVRCVR
jgi:hypothetical protein